MVEPSQKSWQLLRVRSSTCQERESQWPSLPAWCSLGTHLSQLTHNVAGKMQAKLQQQAQWSHLPLKLWAQVFTAIKPVGFAAAESWWVFHQLKIVCQAFDATFKQHNDLYSDVIVNDHNARHVPCLEAWLRRHASFIKNLIILKPTPWLEEILGALQSPLLAWRHSLWPDLYQLQCICCQASRPSPN